MPRAPICARIVRAEAENAKSSGPTQDLVSGKAAAHARRLGDLNPGWAVNPNRISSAAP